MSTIIFKNIDKQIELDYIISAMSPELDTLVGFAFFIFKDLLFNQ